MSRENLIKVRVDLGHGKRLQENQTKDESKGSKTPGVNRNSLSKNPSTNAANPGEQTPSKDQQRQQKQPNQGKQLQQQKQLDQRKNTPRSVQHNKSNRKEYLIERRQAEYDKGISSMCALRRLTSVQMYASRHGELKLFGKVCESINEMERIIGTKKLSEKQTLISEFFDVKNVIERKKKESSK